MYLATCPNSLKSNLPLGELFSNCSDNNKKKKKKEFELTCCILLTLNEKKIIGRN